MSYLRNLGRAMLGRLSEKASAVGPLIARTMLGQPLWRARNVELLGKEGYQQNPIVSRSIRLIAESAAQIPFVLYKGKGEKKKEVDEHPILDLLANPNPSQDGIDFLIAAYSHMLISGNAFIERTTEDRLEHMELYAHRPDRMKIVPGPDGTPQAYIYEVNGMSRRFDTDFDQGLRPILHLKTFHPLDDWHGMSALDPASRAIDIHNASSSWNLALINNSGAPSGAFLYEPQNKEASQIMSDDTYERMKQEIDEQLSGPKGAGKIMLLDGGMKYQAMGLDPEKMQYVDSKTLAAREIAWALGVPPLLLGLPGDNTHANYEEANEAFHRQTVIPLVQRMARQLSHWMARSMGKGVYLEANIDDIDALSADRKDQWERIEKSTVLSINEKREALGYERIDGGDHVYIGAGQIPVDQADAALAGGAAPQDEDMGDQGGPQEGDSGGPVPLLRPRNKIAA